MFLDSSQIGATQPFGNAIGQSTVATYSGATFPLTQAQLNAPLINPPAPPYTASGYYFPAHLQPPYTFHWNVAVEQSLGKNSGAYIDIRGKQWSAIAIARSTPRDCVIGTELLLYLRGNIGHYVELWCPTGRISAHAEPWFTSIGIIQLGAFHRFWIAKYPVCASAGKLGL